VHQRSSRRAPVIGVLNDLVEQSLSGLSFFVKDALVAPFHSSQDTKVAMALKLLHHSAKEAAFSILALGVN
jgi:hypothetical protein